ncbi:ubiquinone biosynthesis O-methyltransferase, mitochondrial-like isoform X3 [Quercus robur]|uniref:ubiquinone biosynthesis O-methyltransferase, mitochondrial-like isoform X3 n=1 Tax=Quercus robur TaxID=38942 RepID=UPI00216289D3|nr:ubiquinone biosynthesis O-methyltransferase, mitochondrial-like isoform X3 [Quercus robur]
MASKLVRHSHLRALSSSISINNHICSPHFSNPNRAPLSFSYKLFSNASSSSSTGGFQRASSLKDLELAKFASIAETCKDPNSATPFEGLKIVDVGCGGGILSEPLARMGATVTGVDAVEKNIKIARIHADLDPVTSTIEYCCTTAEKLVEEDRKFDAVIALELPEGTHEWSSFLTPEELVLILQRANITVREMAGFVYNPLTGRWSLSDDISVNFIAFGTKNCQ